MKRNRGDVLKDSADGVFNMNKEFIKKAAVDINAAKSNQAIIIALLAASFLLKLPQLTLFVGAVMALGTLLGAPGFMPAYKYFLKPLNLVKPRIVDEKPEGLRFAQGLGSVCTLSGALLLFAGSEYAGWGFVFLVIVLAGINLFAGFCVGCHFYYWIKKVKALTP
jgi:hypothetical protein